MPPYEVPTHRLTDEQVREVLGVVLDMLGLAIVGDGGLNTQHYGRREYCNLKVCRSARPTPVLVNVEREIAFRRAREMDRG